MSCHHSSHRSYIYEILNEMHDACIGQNSSYIFNTFKLYLLMSEFSQNAELAKAGEEYIANFVHGTHLMAIWR